MATMTVTLDADTLNHLRDYQRHQNALMGLLDLEARPDLTAADCERLALPERIAKRQALINTAANAVAGRLAFEATVLGLVAPYATSEPR